MHFAVLRRRSDGPLTQGAVPPRRRKVWKRFGSGLLLSLLVVGSTAAQDARPLPPSLPQAESPAAAARGAAGISPVEMTSMLEGTVAEVFGNRFILEADGERILVEPADSQAALSAARGDKVRIEGQRAGTVFRAGRVMRGGDNLLAMSKGEPQTAAAPAVSPERSGLSAVLQRLDLVPIGAPVRKKHHTEILARTKDGRTVYVSFDRSDRLWEIEDANHDKEAAVARGLARPDFVRLASEAGFTPTGVFEQRPRHVELEATNRRGERLTLHMDLAGIIYKQVWLW